MTPMGFSAAPVTPPYYISYPAPFITDSLGGHPIPPTAAYPFRYPGS